MRMSLSVLAAPVLALGLAFAVSPVSAADPDRADPAATAAAFLTAYKARDAAAMAPLVNAKNHELFTALAAQGEAHPAWPKVFGGWRWEAAQASSGTTGPARYTETDEALVPFHDMCDEIAVIVLTGEDGRWAMEDINSPDKATFEALSETPPQPPSQ